MALTNHERVGKALTLLRTGLGPFVERELQGAVKAKSLHLEVLAEFRKDPQFGKQRIAKWDAAALLKVMLDNWNFVFKAILGPAERGFVGELRGHRNRWAHQHPFSSDDAYRVLDTAARLLEAVSAAEAGEVEKLKQDLLRVLYDEDAQARPERRKKASLPLTSAAGPLKPWREVVTPHPDVANGRYRQAEFAADLWQVHLGEGTAEYRDPAEFYRRTYLTESLRGMLVGAVRRVAGEGGDPVIQLQTNFGGGKTHSMLALYHLFSGTPPSELGGVDALIRESSAASLPEVRRVVIVGNKISPGNPVTKPDGTVVRTLWGELAWQLGGPSAYERIARDDERATNPGDALRELLVEHGPCLILIDEWVAYARQLHEDSDLPGGSFETQFSFAQALTESAKLAENCLLVISLPASDTQASPHIQADDLEVGGQRGREALSRLRNVVGRIESSWRPASAEEGFEIVRRRLFEPLDPVHHEDRDAAARAFSDFYRRQPNEFPRECRETDYRKRLQSAYPIHPEIFDRLHTDWSALVTFQRTRGVLRLMAAVVHRLWADGDGHPLILPAHLPMDDPPVQSELTRYLPDRDQWDPVIAKDVDGPRSLPVRTDGKFPNLGKSSACRRVARTVYLGSAPTAGSAHRGIEDRRIRLGCALPQESTAPIGDALRRLAGEATYLYQDGSRYWYDTRPTVTKLAGDRAEQLKGDPKAAEAIRSRLRQALQQLGGFSRIHTAPQSAHDVPDELETRLVVLGTDCPHQRGAADSPAQTAAREILESRGNAPRLYRNTLVFLAPDETRLQDLDEAVRRHLAWESILEEREALDISPHQVKQAKTQQNAADATVAARLPETYQWLLTPVQKNPDDPVTWESARLTGTRELAERAFRWLQNDSLLVPRLAGSLLRTELDRVPLWRGGDHVALQQVIQDFASYLNLPRLLGPEVLVRAVEEAVSSLTWDSDGVGYADGFDEAGGRYRGLRARQTIGLDAGAAGLLVRPAAARRQLEREKPTPSTGPGPDESAVGPGEPAVDPDAPPVGTPDEPAPTRYHGSVVLDAARAGLEASRVAEEVVTHLAVLPGASVRVTLEIEAGLPDGTPDHVVRVVTENSRSLRFASHGFERD